MADTVDADSARTERIAVAEVQRAVVTELGWLFREQHKADYGIDAQVEVVDGGIVVPRLLALQIKGGASRFREPGPGGWWFRPLDRHVRYWLGHALPVVLVLVDTESGMAYWQAITSQTVVATSQGGWKVLVPDSQRLDANAQSALAEVADGDPYVLRLRELQLALPLMSMLAAGHRLMIEIEEHLKDTSGRGSITLGMFHPDPGYTSPLVTWGVALGSETYAEAIPRLLAWADIRADDVPYEDVDLESYQAERGGKGPVLVDDVDFVAWRARRSDRETLGPYLRWPNDQPTVAYWQLELRLNALGRAFMVVDEFAQRGQRLLKVPGGP